MAKQSMRVLRECAVRLVTEHRGETETGYAAIWFMAGAGAGGDGLGHFHKAETTYTGYGPKIPRPSPAKESAATT